MRVKYKYIPPDIRLKYNLDEKVISDIYIYIYKDLEEYTRIKTGSHLSLSTLKDLYQTI